MSRGSILGRLLSAGERRGLSPLQAWISDIDFGSVNSDSGVTATQKNSTALPAVYACTSLIADTIATLPIDSYIQWNGYPKPYRPVPDWLDSPVPNDPSITRVVHFTQVVLSLLFDGNAFIYCLPSVFDPVVVTVLDPNTVIVKRDPVTGRPQYMIRTTSGGGNQTLDSDTIVHIPRTIRPGMLRGMSPIDEARQTVGTAMAAAQNSGRYFRNGLKTSGVLETNADLTQDQADALRDKFTAAHTGQNAYKVGILTGGAKYTPMSVTPEQAQFLETMKWYDLHVARLFRVPPLLIQVNDPGAVSYASADAAVVAFEKHTIRPILVSLERGYARLMPHAKAYLHFDTQGFLRGDPATRYTSYATGLGNGFLNRDEVRGWEELPPLPDGLGQKFTVPLRTIDLAILDEQSPQPVNPAPAGIVPVPNLPAPQVDQPGGQTDAESD